MPTSSPSYVNTHDTTNEKILLLFDLSGGRSLQWLQPVAYINLTYGGPFGNIMTMSHDVYTSTFEASFGGQVLEGIGCVPDQEVLRKDYNGDFKPQLDAAIEYIRNK